MSDWTGGLIERPDVPISALRLPSRVYRMDDDDWLPAKPSGRNPESLMARVKKLVARHGRISTHELQDLLPHEAPKAVAVAARNLVRLREIRQAGRVERTGQRGSGCAIWELADTTTEGQAC